MVGEPANGEKARIKRFIETPRSRRHPDMLVPDDAGAADGSAGEDAEKERNSKSAA